MDSTPAKRLVNVVDVEATCWAGAQPPGEVSDIIEIGLTVVDLDARERVARHGIVVRPARSTVSEFCTELTGLTPHEVGLRLEGRHHRGEDDAWNIAALVLHLAERGLWPEVEEHGV